MSFDVNDHRRAGGRMHREDTEPVDAPPAEDAAGGLPRGTPLPFDAAGPAPATAGPPWPTLDDAALHGPAGDFVAALEPHTESDPVALLVQLLVALGNVIGRGPHHRVEADEHHLNLFAALVGKTSKGRKGTSWGHVRRAMAEADETWLARVVSGLSSGEGLIDKVKDPLPESGEAEGDKRLLVMEPELASVLKVLGRDGNTLSAVVREAWDRGDLQTLTKNSPARATRAHISIIGHITKDELVRYLTATETANGFANRFLWVCVQRSKFLPEGGDPPQDTLRSLLSLFRDRVTYGRTLGRMARTPEARERWRDAYRDLSADRPGLLGVVTSRAEAQVPRLSCLYAILDRSRAVSLEHLEAALALWRYCEDSAAYVFGDALGDPDADRILGALRRSPDGLSRTEISKLFERHAKASALERALGVLLQAGRAKVVRRETTGRPEERWTVARVKGPGAAKEGTP